MIRPVPAPVVGTADANAVREARDMRCPVARRRYVLTERELLDPGVDRKPREPQA